jgi:hypothetical protein
MKQFYFFSSLKNINYCGFKNKKNHVGQGSWVAKMILIRGDVGSWVTD